MIRIHNEKISTQIESDELWDEIRCEDEMSNSMADAWASRNVSGQSPTPRLNKQDNIRAEFSSYLAEVTNYKFSAKDSRQYWGLARSNGNFPHLGRLARLFLL